MQITTTRGAAAQPNTRQWASLTEAALHAGVSTKTMRRWVASGFIRAYRVGPKLLKVDLNEVDAAFNAIPTAAA